MKTILNRNRLARLRDDFVKKEASLLKNGTKVLDVGAGPTKYRPYFSHCEYYAQDFAQHEPIQEGQFIEKDWHYGPLDFVSDATAIPVEPETFDAVLCTEVLEHVPAPDLVLKEITRILKPAGKLILTAPLSSGLHQEPHHFYGGYTPYYYELKLGELGFKDINVEPNGGFFSFHSQETERFSAMLAPWRQPLWTSIFLLPVWLVTLPWARFIYPALAPGLDKLDKHKGFTVGYHVTATKKSDTD